MVSAVSNFDAASYLNQIKGLSAPSRCARNTRRFHFRRFEHPIHRILFHGRANDYLKHTRPVTRRAGAFAGSKLPMDRMRACFPACWAAAILPPAPT